LDWLRRDLVRPGESFTIRIRRKAGTLLDQRAEKNTNGGGKVVVVERRGDASKKGKRKKGRNPWGVRKILPEHATGLHRNGGSPMQALKTCQSLDERHVYLTLRWTKWGSLKPREKRRSLERIQTPKGGSQHDLIQRPNQALE